MKACYVHMYMYVGLSSHAANRVALLRIAYIQLRSCWSLRGFVRRERIVSTRLSINKPLSALFQVRLEKCFVPENAAADVSTGWRAHPALPSE